MTEQCSLKTVECIVNKSTGKSNLLYSGANLPILYNDSKPGNKFEKIV